MRVWHIDESLAKGPTLSSQLGIVNLNGFPSVDLKVISSVADSWGILEHAIPYVPFSAVKGLISDEIIE